MPIIIAFSNSTQPAFKDPEVELTVDWKLYPVRQIRDRNGKLFARKDDSIIADWKLIPSDGKNKVCYHFLHPTRLLILAIFGMKARVFTASSQLHSPSFQVAHGTMKFLYRESYPHTSFLDQGCQLLRVAHRLFFHPQCGGAGYEKKTG